MATLLGERGVYVPAGSKTEREQTHGMLRESLGIQDCTACLTDTGSQRRTTDEPIP
jgi:hypothetical protein